MLSMFQYDFMVRALIAGLAAGIVCPAVGVFLVLRRYSFMADTLAHISLAGVALGLWLGVASALSPFLTLAVAVCGALLVDRLRTRERVSADALLALMMSGGLALAVVFFGLAGGAPVDVTSYLFGSLLTVGSRDVWLILSVAVCVLLLLALLAKEFYYVCSDEESARVAGLPVDRLNLLFILMVAVTVAVCLRMVGTLLVGALMVIPVLAALLVGRSFRQVVLISVIIGVTATLCGLTASYQLGIAAGGCIVITALLFFGALYGAKTLLNLCRRSRTGDGSGQAN
ncbi:MAG TPA: metal ABC transporter permease [Syntrophomonadaceae bacterium]|nr:metal ABC transporter permease [Syntrophomonadaceae bacterium]